MTYGGDSWNDGDGVEFDGWWFEEFTCMLVLLVALCDDNGECLYYTPRGRCTK